MTKNDINRIYVIYESSRRDFIKKTLGAAVATTLPSLQGVNTPTIEDPSKLILNHLRLIFTLDDRSITKTTMKAAYNSYTKLFNFLKFNGLLTNSLEDELKNIIKQLNPTQNDFGGMDLEEYFINVIENGQDLDIDNDIISILYNNDLISTRAQQQMEKFFGVYKGDYIEDKNNEQNKNNKQNSIEDKDNIDYSPMDYKGSWEHDSNYRSLSMGESFKIK